MCGIAGIVGNKATEHCIEAMLHQQKHRGPDAQGIWCNEGICLGHNRLSIIDLSSDANQPMFSDDGDWIIVFNGEIYNYIELKKELGDYPYQTNSDTEVLLFGYKRWGTQILEKLNGMFSFAIWNKKEQTLFAARDRFGVKPFYYYSDSENLIFASEIPSIFAGGIEKKANNKVWSNYFMFGDYGLPNETFWKNIHSLPAGHFMFYKNKNFTINKWYHFEDRIYQLQNSELNTYNEEEHITHLLNDSIALRFRSDVPVGFNLSGGLDSSILLALIHYQYKADSSSVEAFTFYTDDNRYDELHWVDTMLKDKKFPLNRCLLTFSDVPEKAYQIAQIQGEPFGGVPTIAYSEVFKRAKEKGVKVLLDGQGSDEAWAGYDYYVKDTNSVIQGVSHNPLRPNVLIKDFVLEAMKPQYLKPFNDNLMNLQYRDLFYTKIPRALRFNDRVSMMHGTELREPFLDYRLVEYIFSREKNFKIKDGVQKWFLRKLANNYLSDEVALAPKRPLQTPQREWLSEDLKDWVGDTIGLLEKSPWFDKKELKKELDFFFKGNNESSFHIWQWINTALLLK